MCQPGNGRHRLKGKIAGPEFNKLLQSTCGFVCARTRKKSLARCAAAGRTQAVTARRLCRDGAVLGRQVTGGSVALPGPGDGPDLGRGRGAEQLWQAPRRRSGLDTGPPRGV